jgi:hypothetical protein
VIKIAQITPSIHAGGRVINKCPGMKVLLFCYSCTVLLGENTTHRLFLERNKTTPHFPLHVSSSFLETSLGRKCIRIVLEKRRIVIRCLSNYHLTPNGKHHFWCKREKNKGPRSGCLRHNSSVHLMLKLLLSCITNGLFFFFFL